MRLIHVGQCGLGLWHWLMLDDRGRPDAEEVNFGSAQEAVAHATAYAQAFEIAVRIEVDGGTGKGSPRRRRISP